MKILVACEFSGRVRDAFRNYGHEAISCDYLPTEQPGPHYEGDLRDIITESWDMMLAFPTCTQICASGNHKWAGTPERAAAIEFVRYLMNQPIPRICIENPIGQISTYIRKPDQIIQPWQYGHGETKATYLWLKNLPKLQPTNIVIGRDPRIYRIHNGKSPYPSENWKQKTRMWPGVADAMASQWG